MNEISIRVQFHTRRQAQDFLNAMTGDDHDVLLAIEKAIAGVIGDECILPVYVDTWESQEIHLAMITADPSMWIDAK